MRHTDGRVQNTKIIQGFRQRAQHRARLSTGQMLLQAKSGRKPFNTFHMGLFRACQQTAGTGGKTLQKTAAGFRKQGIIRQRALAGTTRAHKRNELARRQGQIDMPQCVLTGSRYADIHSPKKHLSEIPLVIKTTTGVYHHICSLTHALVCTAPVHMQLPLALQAPLQ